jgi:ribosomal protein L4
VKVLPQLGANVRDIVQADFLVVAERALPALVKRVTRAM